MKIKIIRKGLCYHGIRHGSKLATIDNHEMTNTFKEKLDWTDVPENILFGRNYANYNLMNGMICEIEYKLSHNIRIISNERRMYIVAINAYITIDELDEDLFKI